MTGKQGREADSARPEERKPSDSKGLTRRQMLGATASTGAAAAGVVAGVAGPGREAEVPEAAPQSPTYRETEHIRQYYRRARY